MRKTILAAALALFAAQAAAQTQPLLGYGSWYDVPTPVSEYTNQYMLVWLNDTTLPTGFPPVPSCLTLKTGASARAIWQRARTDWITRHPELMRAPGDPPNG